MGSIYPIIVSASNTQGVDDLQILAILESDASLKIRLHGDLSLANHGPLRSLLEDVLEKSSQTEVLADLSRVNSISSSSFGALVDFSRRLKKQNRRFLLQNPSESCRRAMNLLNLGSFLEVQSP